LALNIGPGGAPAPAPRVVRPCGRAASVVCWPRALRLGGVGMRRMRVAFRPLESAERAAPAGAARGVPLRLPERGRAS